MRFLHGCQFLVCYNLLFSIIGEALALNQDETFSQTEFLGCHQSPHRFELHLPCALYSFMKFSHLKATKKLCRYSLTSNYDRESFLKSKESPFARYLTADTHHILYYLDSHSRSWL